MSLIRGRGGRTFGKEIKPKSFQIPKGYSIKLYKYFRGFGPEITTLTGVADNKTENVQCFNYEPSWADARSLKFCNGDYCY